MLEIEIAETLDEAKMKLKQWESDALYWSSPSRGIRKLPPDDGHCRKCGAIREHCCC